MILRPHPHGLDEQEYLVNLPQNNDHIAQQIANNHGQLPAIPPVEIHPYLNVFPLGDYDKYIIGTFPPISYLYKYNLPALRQPVFGGNIGRRIPNPIFYFFHGNKKLLWDYFLTDIEFNNIPQNKDEVPQYLINILNSPEIEINYSDIIKSTQRQLDNNKYTGKDKFLYNIQPNLELITHILNNQNAQYLLFNTASIYGVQGLELDNNGRVSLENDTKSFDVFVRTLQELNYEVQFSFDEGYTWVPIANLNQNQRKIKLFFKMKIQNNDSSDFCKSFQKGTEREFSVVTPFSPAVAHRPNLLAGNPIVCNWRVNNNFQNTTVMLSAIMSYFRTNNWQELQNMNINF
ncbi:MAG: hypothetical protein WCY89_07060 [Flavobacteriaceae bacterium]